MFDKLFLTGLRHRPIRCGKWNQRGEPMHKDHVRAQKRYKLVTGVTVTTPRSTLQAKTMDISQNGIRIRSQASIRPGTEVTLQIQPSNELKVMGEVKWVFDRFSKGRSCYQVGIQTEGVVHYETRNTLQNKNAAETGMQVVRFPDRSKMLKEIMAQVQTVH